jgi:hypothetical protein
MLSVSAVVKVNEHVAVPVVVDTACAEQAVIWPALSVKATVPPSGVGETVAVKVTDSPVVDGFADDDNEVDVAVLVGALTTWANGVEVVDPAKVPTPENVAVMLSVSAVVKVKLQVAWPVVDDTACVAQPVIWPLLSVKATVPPSGVGETVAVKVTDSPVVDGFADELNEVVVAVSGFTTWASGVEVVDPVKLPLPE